MSNFYRAAQRASFDAVPVTCPTVDAAFADCLDSVKGEISKLREALTDWIERALIAEDKVEDLEHELSDFR